MKIKYHNQYKKLSRNLPEKKVKYKNSIDNIANIPIDMAIKNK